VSDDWRFHMKSPYFFHKIFSGSGMGRRKNIVGY
jgi:hypothetical protein